MAQARHSPVRRLYNGMRAYASDGSEIGTVALVGPAGGALQVVDGDGRSLRVERARITAIGGDHVVLRLDAGEWSSDG